MSVTLSVPEILTDVMAAFKLEAHSMLGPSGFGTDFSSSTAVLGDKITAKLSHVPVVGDYDENNGGFAAPAQDVTELLEDVPVVLNRMPVVTVKLPFLTTLAAKDPKAFRGAVGNMGHALAKRFLSEVFAEAITNVSHSHLMPPALTTLDSFEVLREVCNGQRMTGKNRFCFVNTPLASALGADDRVKSELFHAQKNGEQGYRRWTNVAGFSWIREDPEFPSGGGDLAGLAGDRRLVGVALRQIKNASNVAEQLRIPKVMEFYPVVDKETELPLTGVAWQEGGTGNLYLSVAALLGLHVGNGGGANGSMTDDAGCFLRSS